MVSINSKSVEKIATNKNVLKTGLILGGIGIAGIVGFLIYQQYSGNSSTPSASSGSSSGISNQAPTNQSGSSSSGLNSTTGSSTPLSSNPYLNPSINPTTLTYNISAPTLSASGQSIIVSPSYDITNSPSLSENVSYSSVNNVSNAPSYSNSVSSNYSPKVNYSPNNSINTSTSSSTAITQNQQQTNGLFNI